MPYMSKYQRKTSGTGSGEPAELDRRTLVVENASGNQITVPTGTGILPTNAALIDVSVNTLDQVNGAGYDWTHSGQVITFNYNLTSDRVVIKFFIEP